MKLSEVTAPPKQAPSLKKNEIHEIINKKWGLPKTCYEITLGGSVQPTNPHSKYHHWGTSTSHGLGETKPVMKLSRMPFRIMPFPETTFTNGAVVSFAGLGLETLVWLPLDSWKGQLDLSGNDFTTLDKPIAASTVWLNGCKKLEVVKNLPETMKALNLNYCPKVTRFEGIRKVEELFLWDNSLESLETVPAIGRFLAFGYCAKLESFKDCHKHLKFSGNGEIRFHFDFNVKHGLLDLIHIEGLKTVGYNRSSGSMDPGEQGTIDPDIEKLLNIVKKYLGQGLKGYVKAQREAIENDLEDYV